MVFHAAQQLMELSALEAAAVTKSAGFGCAPRAQQMLTVTLRHFSP